MKKCSWCKETKSLDNFSNRKSSNDGKYSWCKQCKADKDRKYRNKNKKKLAENKQQYYEKNKEYLTEYKQQWYENNKEKILKKRKKHYKDNKETISLKSAKWRANNKEKKRARDRQYMKDNRDRLRKRRQNNPQVRIADNLRGRIRTAIKNNVKAGSAVRDLGCSVQELKQHLESQFYSHPETNEIMSWKNYGLYGWHIDHIKPLASFDLTDRKQFLEACNYTNLQPLWAEENLTKGDKINICLKS